MFLSQDQINELMKIIESQVTGFVAFNVGSDVLTEDDRTLLQKYGVDVSNIVDENNLMEQSFKLGILSEAIGHKKSQEVTYEQMKEYIDSQKYIPFTETERAALENVKNQAYSDIKGLGNRIQRDTRHIIIEADRERRAEYEDIIQDAAERNVANRETIRNMVSELGHKTGDWNRDFGRIADYVNHMAFDTGRSSHIQKQHGKDAYVYKDVYPGACRHCIRLYLTKGFGSKPRIFKLQTLQANGTNIGRKAKDWRPVVGPTHPWCRCTLAHYDPRYEFNPKTRRYDIPKEDVEPQVPRRSSVTVTVGDETVEV